MTEFTYSEEYIKSLGRWTSDELKRAGSLQQMLDAVRANADCNIIRTDSDFQPNDLYRVIASVEESNAEFEAFVMHGWAHEAEEVSFCGTCPSKKKLVVNPPMLCGKPVVYSEHVAPKEVFGGMWSDFVDGRIRHGVAFSYYCPIKKIKFREFL